MTGKIVISIPIELETRQDVASALLERYGTDYLFMGRIFQSNITDETCQISISAKLNDDEKFAKQDKISRHTLGKVERCRQIVYLTSTEVGYQTCLMMNKFAQVFLNIGGVAVNIESSEIAHESSFWLDRYDSPDIFDIYSLYVGLVEGNSSYFSCGMHNFGKADVSIPLNEDIGLAIYVMNVFNYYRLTESPILQDGHTFRPDIESPTYQLQLVEDDEYEASSLQYNSLGRWHLNRQEGSG